MNDMRCQSSWLCGCMWCFFFQAEDGIRDVAVTGVQTCALPIYWLLRAERATDDVTRTEHITARSIQLIASGEIVGRHPTQRAAWEALKGSPTSVDRKSVV